MRASSTSTVFFASRYSVMGLLPRTSARVRPGYRTPKTAGSVRRHVDRQAETGEVMQRLVDADQRPEPRMLILQCHAHSRCAKPLGAIDGDVNGEVDEGDEPEFRRDDQDQQQRHREVDQTVSQ